MGTKSNRSAGSQFTPNGPVQGNVLVDPNTGQPVGVITDTNGVHRIAVDAELTADTIVVDTRPLSASTDAVRVEDPNTGAHVRVENDGSINANVKLTAANDTVSIADQISDNKMVVNPDGSINISESDLTPNPTPKSFFNSVTAVAASATQTIVTYTVPVGKTALLQRVSVSGSNFGNYSLMINGVEQDRKRTYLGGPISESMNYTAEPKAGLKFIAGDQIAVNVTNYRPFSGDYEARIQVIEVG